jgi:hypothetical protein
MLLRRNRKNGDSIVHGAIIVVPGLCKDVIMSRLRKLLRRDGWGYWVAPWGLGFDSLVRWILCLVKKNSLAVSRSLKDSVSCAPPFGLNCCRMGSYSRPVSDGRLEFESFLDRNMLVPWLLSHQWVVCALSANPSRCRWGRLFPPRLSFFFIMWRLAWYKIVLDSTTKKSSQICSFAVIWNRISSMPIFLGIKTWYSCEEWHGNSGWIWAFVDMYKWKKIRIFIL